MLEQIKILVGELIDTFIHFVMNQVNRVTHVITWIPV